MVNATCNRSPASHYDHYHLLLCEVHEITVIQCNVQKFSQASAWGTWIHSTSSHHICIKWIL